MGITALTDVQLMPRCFNYLVSILNCVSNRSDGIPKLPNINDDISYFVHYVT